VFELSRSRVSDISCLRQRNLGRRRTVSSFGLKRIPANGDSSLQSALSRVAFRRPERLAIAAGVTIVYFVSGRVGLHFATVHPSATAIWAPSGIALAACLLFGSWIWSAIFVGAFLVNVTTYGSLATSIAIGIGNTGEALIGAYLVRRFARGLDLFERTKDTFRFVLFAAIISTPVSATIGVLSLCIAGYASWSKFLWMWFTWWTGDATGDLIVAPLLILWARTPRLHREPQKIIEAALLVGTLLLTAGIVFDGFLPFWGPQYPNAFLCIPVLLWSAFRFGPRDTATIVFFLSIAAIAGPLGNIGPFSQGGRNQELLLVQAFVAVVGTSHLIVAIEVAERRRLDRTRWRLGAILESSDDAIVAITSGGYITDWNASAERMYGFSAAEAIGNLVSLVIPPDRKIESAEVLARINHGELVAPFETVRLRKDGVQVDVSLTVSPVKDGDGHIIGASENARDITRLMQARQERENLLRSESLAREAAESANRAKDEFLAMLGHELRNPLHAISMAAHLLQNPNSLEKASGIITRQGAHVSRLVDDLLDASRVTGGRIVLTRRPLNLATLVSECVGSMRATGQFDHHAVEIDLGAVWVDGDTDRLAQVVTNLLDNAIKYTPSGGKIGVRVKKVSQKARIEVQDDGAGISSEILPRVFDLFARGEFGLHRSPAGLGIGLTLVKQIAELHGGRAEVASDGPGRGSIFTVTLPRVAAPQVKIASRDIDPGEESFKPRRILLIEDNDDARQLLRTLLEASGHEIYEAGDGPAGVEKALELKPDVVLIDLGLPGLDGYKVAARIRSTPACSAIVLIALTGYGQREYRAKAERSGFHAYLVKPVDSGELEKVIATVGREHGVAARG
jgi:PAS domain S-box-containing protein